MADEVEEETPQNTQTDMEVEPVEPVNETLKNPEPYSSQNSDFWFLQSQKEKKKESESEVNFISLQWCQTKIKRRID